MKEEKKLNKIIGFTSVVGDLFHAGHIRMIEECKEHCDYLIVGLICDPTDRKGKNVPVESVYERYYRIKRCKGVDEVVPLQNEKDLKLYLEMCSNVKIRFVGEDYKGKEFTGKDVCERKGIEIYYNDRGHGLSSTDLRKRVEEATRNKHGNNK